MPKINFNDEDEWDDDLIDSLEDSPPSPILAPEKRFILKSNFVLDAHNVFSFSINEMKELVSIQENPDVRYPSLTIIFINKHNSLEQLSLGYYGSLTPEEILFIGELVKKGIFKAKKVELFKELLKVNPIASPEELWSRAEESLRIIEFSD